MPRENRPPYFPFYPNDFTADGVVEAMTTESVGAYILLLCKAWSEEPPGTIPNNDAVLARWARLSPERWTECKPEVTAAFSLGTDNRWHQKRLRHEYARLREFSKHKSLAGKAGAKARWQTHGSAIAQPMANDGSSHSSSHSNTPNGGTARAAPPPLSDSPKPGKVPRQKSAQEEVAAEYVAGWLRVYPSAGSKSPPGKEHFVMLAKLVKEHGRQRVSLALRRYLDERDPYLVKAAHPLELFAKQFDRFNAGNGARAANVPLAGTIILNRDS